MPSGHLVERQISLTASMRGSPSTAGFSEARSPSCLAVPCRETTCLSALICGSARTYNNSCRHVSCNTRSKQRPFLYLLLSSLLCQFVVTSILHKSRVSGDVALLDKTMPAVEQAPHSHVRLPRQRLRSFAKTLLQYHDLTARKSLESPYSDREIKIVCISDTHNHQPELPDGDILLHAGDLTEHGSFDEIQSQLDYINAQPHTHKIIVAGNHDVLLDEAFLAKHPERRHNDTRTHADLRWGKIVYLERATAHLYLPHRAGRTLRIYGSPHTPAYGVAAFQHPPEEDVWAGRVSAGTDVILTHGPPRGHLDGEPHAGCAYLGREVARVAPRLVVSGHIHAGYGVERVRYDRVRTLFEAIDVGWREWDGLLEMLFLVLVCRLLELMGCGGRQRMTTLVNASVVGGRGKEGMNEPVVVRL